MNNQPDLETIIKERLNEIKPAPARDAQVAARGRARFMAQAVSASEFQRHKGWKSIFRKEQFAMNMIVSVLVIAGLLFGGGATVNAAQDDLPNEPLYALKLWSEELGLRFQNNPEQKADRLMELAQIRVQEMMRLTDARLTVPDQVRLRLEQHIHQALELCENMDDATLDRTLLQIRARLQQQDRDLEQLQIHATQNVQPILAQTRTMLHTRLQLVDDGLLDHEMFRNAIRNGFRYGQEDDVAPPVQNGNGGQNSQPSPVPGGPNNESGGPNTDPGGPDTEPGEPNTDPGGPNTDPGGPSSGPGEPDTDPRSDNTGGDNNGGNGAGNKSP
jgi:hypothetical protein